MTSLFRAFNALLPFTNPSTPLWRDIIHTLVLCTALYLAPNVDWQKVFNSFRRPQIATPPEQEEQEVQTLQEDPGQRDEAHVQPENLAGNYAEEEVEPEAEWEPPWPQDANGTETQLEEPVEEQAPEEAGPANGQPARRQRDPNREVGAKKAKSLARRERERAYNEFMREQGETQRAMWASDAAKREEETRAERQRRMVVEAQIYERERRAREEKKEKEERERREEIEAVRRAGEIVAEGLEQKRMIKVEEVSKAVKRDEKWVEQLVRREGMLGAKTLNDGKKKVTILTGRGWLVTIDEETMSEAYKRAAKSSESGGKVSWEELGLIIQEVLVDSSK